MYVGKYTLERYKKRNPMFIEISNLKNKGRINISIFDPGKSNEWEHVSFSSGGRDPHIKEILIDLPTKKAREICTDSLIKKTVPKKFYDFLDKLNIDIIKTQMV